MAALAPTSQERSRTAEIWRDLACQEFANRLRLQLTMEGNKKIRAVALKALDTSIHAMNDLAGASDLKNRFIENLTSLCETYEIAPIDPSNWIGQANKYALIALKQFNKVDQIEAAPVRTIPSDLFKKYMGGSPVPREMIEWDTSQAHTIPIADYLRVRISDAICYQMKRCGNVDVFIGSFEEMQKFYSELGFRILGEMCTNSSLRFFFIQSRSNPDVQKVVVCNVRNDSKLTHLLLELRYSDVDMETVLIRGDIAIQRSISVEALQNEIFENVPHDVDMAFIGIRAQVLIEVAKRFYPAEMAEARALRKEKETAELLLGKNHRLRTVEDLGGVFSYSLIEMEIQGKNWSIIALKMPNGDLSYPATVELIRRGVRNFVLLGAGGSLDESAGLGSYQLIQSTALRNGPEIDLGRIPLLQVTLPSEISVHTRRRNQTVRSPLEETKAWEEDALGNKFHSVDCETYYIAKALHEASGLPIRILPGIFTSDVIGHNPLKNKVGVTAHTHLSYVVENCFNAIGMPKSLESGEEEGELPSSIQLDPSFLDRSAAILRNRVGKFPDFLRGFLQHVNKQLETLNFMFSGGDFSKRIKACELWNTMRKELIFKVFYEHIIPEFEAKKIPVDKTCCIFTHDKFRDRFYSVEGTFSLILILDLNSPGKEIVNRYMQQLREIGIRVDCKFIPRQFFKPTAHHLLHLNRTWMIGGSEKLRGEIFDFSDQQLAELFCGLIGKKDLVVQMEGKLKDLSYKGRFMPVLIHLAALKQHKDWVLQLPKDSSILAPYPFKCHLIEMADLMFTLNLDSSLASLLEWLGLTLSHIISRQKSHNGVHPLLRSEAETIQLTIRQMKGMTLEDRIVIAELLERLKYNVDPQDPNFIKGCLTALWDLSRKNLELVSNEQSRLKLVINSLIQE